MSYLVKAVGIDLATASSGVSALTMREGTWETQVIDAGAAFINHNVPFQMTKFAAHLAGAKKMVEFVKKHKPDIVGVEDYTNQRHSHVGFSMGEVGGIMRLLLWEEGYRQILIVPSRAYKFVTTKDQAGEKVDESLSKSAKVNKLKKHVMKWVEHNLQAKFEGTFKQQSDQADATIYALIAAVFFSGYWLNSWPPLMIRQREIFYNRVPSPNSKLAKSGWVPNGLMDKPYHHLIRNPPMEAQVYTPEWLQRIPVEQKAIYVGY